MLILCFSAFVCFGVVLVLAGANQAEIAADLGLDLARSGLLVSTLAIGIGIGVVGAGPLFDRHARRPLFVGSTLLAAAALISVDANIGYSRLLVHLIAIGVGIGAYDTLINALVIERFRDRAARPMTIVHAGATVGAMFGPALAGFAITQLHWTASFHWTGYAHLALAAAALAYPFPKPPARLPTRPTSQKTRHLAFTPAMLPFAAIAFAYVGVEAAMTIFAVPYANGVLQLSPDHGRLAISAFWSGLLVGRIGSAASAKLLQPRLFIVAGLLGAACIVAGVVSKSAEVLVIFGLTGLAWGCVYPLMIALAGRQFPKTPGTATGLAAGFGAAGGFAVPWLTGAIGDSWGVATAVGSIAFWSVVVAAGGMAAARLRPPPFEDLR
ncbi:MAG: MFS transporter [Deltaproteobacteria bacterium]|nr:MFS transporter [Deltaproteobacteria bacterium]